MKIKHWILVALAATVISVNASTQPICWSMDSALIPEMVEAFAYTYHYNPTVTQEINGETLTVDNPETPAQFTKKQIAKYALEVRNAYRIEKAAKEAAEAAKAESLESNSIGI